jgi:hypothetical protein
LADQPVWRASVFYPQEPPSGGSSLADDARSEPADFAAARCKYCVHQDDQGIGTAPPHSSERSVELV